MFLGGSSGTGYVKDLYGYSPSENKCRLWLLIKRNAYGVSVCTQDDNVYAVAGITMPGGILNCILIVVILGLSLLPLESDKKMECIFPTSFVYKDSIILIGGESLGESNLAVRDTIYRYDMINQEWSVVEISRFL